VSGAQERVADIFEKAYRGAGGTGNARSRLELRADRLGGRSRQTCRRLHADEGIGDISLSDNQNDRRMPDGTRRLPRSDVRLVAIAGASLARAERRRAAIAAMTDQIDPEWSMTAHPVVRAAIRLLGVPLVTTRIGDIGRREVGNESLADTVAGYEFDDAHASMKVVAGHLWSAFLEEKRTGLSLSQNHGRNICRIVLRDVSVPSTVAVAMQGQPLAAALDHPLIDMLPDLRIHRLLSPDMLSPGATGMMAEFAAKMNRRPKTIIEVLARPVPLEDPPEGADVSWRRLPSLHYADIE